jgi:hypothetical protein
MRCVKLQRRHLEYMYSLLEYTFLFIFGIYKGAIYMSEHECVNMKPSQLINKVYIQNMLLGFGIHRYNVPVRTFLCYVLIKT